MHKKIIVFTILTALAVFLTGATGLAEEKVKDAVETPGPLALAEAVMCEGIESYAPRTPAVVFSINIGKVSCFTNFVPVPEKTHIYHRWYFKDRLSTQKRLHLKPPNWATYSSIQLREADQGPWRVEVTDKDGHIFETLRFSITD